MFNGRVYNQLLRAMKYIKKGCECSDGLDADEKAVCEWKLFFARESIISIYLSACRALSDGYNKDGKKLLHD